MKLQESNTVAKSGQDLLGLQGFIVVRMAEGSGAVGDILPWSGGGQGIPDLQGPMVIVSAAGFAEWQAQHVACGKSLPEVCAGFEFWKVVAE